MGRIPSKEGVSDTLSPPKILEVISKVDMGHKKIAFGSYAVVNIVTVKKMRSRCVPAIELKAPNDSGDYYFMNIFTGK